LIIGKYLRKHGKLNRETIVSTVMSNLGFELAIQQEGMKLARTQVGDRYVLEEMIAKGYSIGGEQSGHIILTEHSTTGDGLLTALTLLKAIVEDGRPFSEIAKVMEEYPQVLVNAKVPNSLKHRILENVAIRARIDHLEKKYAGEGRILIRPSGTEPLVRVMIEGSDREMIKKDAKELADWIESTIQPD
ncbi:MAG: phosphoglucosamine mutase, partial [Bacillota bacterium]|nr:phosphoglucosamine mutase [Bacillota bacterium]